MAKEKKEKVSRAKVQTKDEINLGAMPEALPETESKIHAETIPPIAMMMAAPREIQLPQIGFGEGILISIFAWPLACLRAIQELMEVSREIRSFAIISYYLSIIFLPLILIPAFMLLLFGLDFNFDNFMRIVFFELFLSIAFFALVMIVNYLYSVFSSSAVSSGTYKAARRNIGLGTFISLALSFVLAFGAIDFLVPAFLTVVPAMLLTAILALALSIAVMSAVIAGREFF